MAIDAISILQFTIPLVIAILFSVLTLSPKGKDKPNSIFTGSLVTFFSAMLSVICWFILAITWPAVATDAMFVSVAYLWYAIAFIFVVLTIVAAFKMVTAYFDNHNPKPKKLRMQESTEEE